MLSKVKQIWNNLRQVNIFTSKGNTLILQAYPRKNILYVSYKGKVKTAYFHDETMRHMLHGGANYKKHADRFLTAAGQLIQQIIKD